MKNENTIVIMVVLIYLLIGFIFFTFLTKYNHKNFLVYTDKQVYQTDSYTKDGNCISFIADQGVVIPSMRGTGIVVKKDQSIYYCGIYKIK